MIRSAEVALERADPLAYTRLREVKEDEICEALFKVELCLSLATRQAFGELSARGTGAPLALLLPRSVAGDGNPVCRCSSILDRIA
jgi:hypothetical protein